MKLTNKQKTTAIRELWAALFDLKEELKTQLSAYLGEGGAHPAKEDYNHAIKILNKYKDI